MDDTELCQRAGWTRRGGRRVVRACRLKTAPSSRAAGDHPKVLLTYIAAALDAVQPIAERVFDALASPVSSVLGSVVPRLGSAFWSMTTPVALVLDDVHLLHNSECRRPGLGTLIGEAGALRARLAKERGSAVPGPSALTAAELRLLPMLSTHLQLHEIAAERYLSQHTVRNQGKSIYRKLGAASRSQAVARARELGLLEG
jgi:DNA-binding CsgD family transcriptional regulator